MLSLLASLGPGGREEKGEFGRQKGKTAAQEDESFVCFCTFLFGETFFFKKRGRSSTAAIARAHGARGNEIGEDIPSCRRRGAAPATAIAIISPHRPKIDGK